MSGTKATIDPQRRAFLRGSSAGILERPRMPWADQHFFDTCKRCDECLSACAPAILLRGDGGYPTVDFSRGGCSFCGACVQVCRYGALSNVAAPPWNLRVQIGNNCFSRSGISCRSCGDACYRGAITFRLQTRGRAEAMLDEASCTACGACVAVCPANAISVEERA